jgi:shikimate kinase
MAVGQRNIYLIGPRASGKTSLGQMLAQELDRPFVDLDQAFAHRTGQSIAQVVEGQGWERFRELESEVLEATAEIPGQVVGTGGGVVLSPQNRQVLAKGVVVYLQADPEKLVARLMDELLPGQRPALTELSLEEEVRRTVSQREPMYLACAHLILPDRPLTELLPQLAGELKAWPE